MTEKLNDPVRRDGKTISFGAGAKFMARRKNYGVAAVRSIHIKVSNSLVSGETCVELDSNVDTIVLGKECMSIYNWNIPVKVSVWKTKDGERFLQIIS